MKRIVNGVPRECPGDGVMPALPDGVPGVFETVLWREGQPVFWSAHWNRFVAGCEWFGFAPPASAASIVDSAHHLAAANGVTTGVLRFAAFREPNGITWTIDVTPPRPHMAKTVFRVNWGPTLPAATADRAHKHLARGRWLEALRQARDGGCDETLLCDPSGQLVEAAVSNVFVVNRGVLRTPGLGSGALPGIVRAELLALARSNGCAVEEGRLTRAEVEGASEVWLTNSLIGIRLVIAIGGAALPSAPTLLPTVRRWWQAVHGWDPCASI